MANINAPSNAFGPGNQPTPGNTRGKSSKTKILNALKKKMNWSEDDLYEHIVSEAFVNNNKDMIEIVIKTAVPIPKTTLQPVNFQYDRNAAYHEKCEVILEAVAAGQIAPDVGQELIYTIKHIASIHEVTELEKRLNDLEDLLRGFGDLNK
ncbi:MULTISPECIES: hypothetical protein [Burkholderia cepacia complex]|uniref:Uncharacterized protein n=1 Tax=Burkholderia vietnamiensis TaxID=60552 RepID=A0AAW7T8D3_BURVI|nr:MULTISPECIES: hypothetical protein [Burkholderia cepacia complex]MBU9639587.1 hypothetical protein [Burkholderia multivorans]MDN7798343.1 hypothetical protein [Burkholderia vietnamiensis]